MKIFLTAILVIVSVNSFAQSTKTSSSKTDLNSGAYNSIVTKENLSEDLIAEGFLIVANRYRSKKGKNNLQDNDLLRKASCIHSEQMKQHNFFSHINNKNKKYRTAEDRANEAGYKFSFLAENIFYGSYSFQAEHTYQYLIDDILKTFYESPPHNKNLLDNRVTQSGICAVVKINSSKNSYQIYLTHLLGSSSK